MMALGADSRLFFFCYCKKKANPVHVTNFIYFFVFYLSSSLKLFLFSCCGVSDIRNVPLSPHTQFIFPQSPGMLQ